MEQSLNRGEIERKLEQTQRLAMYAGDYATYQRLREFAEELKQTARSSARAKHKEAIRSRAHEIWEEHGRPVGRDEEFWLQAEREVQQGS